MKQPGSARRQALRLLRALIGWPALALGLYMLAAWIGSSIPRNGDWREPERGIEILVETNGVHTAIVMPIVTPEKDWRGVFPAREIRASAQPYTHLSVSWGERAVYLETPTWADLSPWTVLRIVTAGGDGVLHVAHYLRPAPGAAIRPLRLRPGEYARLAAWIEAHSPDPETRRRHAGYGEDDVFYDAPGRYTPVRTCNQWTGDALAAAGVKIGRWTPMAGGVMKWVPPLATRRP